MYFNKTLLLQVYTHGAQLDKLRQFKTPYYKKKILEHSKLD